MQPWRNRRQGQTIETLQLGAQRRPSQRDSPGCRAPGRPQWPWATGSLTSQSLALATKRVEPGMTSDKLGSMTNAKKIANMAVIMGGRVQFISPLALDHKSLAFCSDRGWCCPRNRSSFVSKNLPPAPPENSTLPDSASAWVWIFWKGCTRNTCLALVRKKLLEAPCMRRDRQQHQQRCLHAFSIKKKYPNSACHPSNDTTPSGLLKPRSKPPQEGDEPGVGPTPRPTPILRRQVISAMGHIIGNHYYFSLSSLLLLVDTHTMPPKTTHSYAHQTIDNKHPRSHQQPSVNNLYWADLVGLSVCMYVCIYIYMNIYFFTDSHINAYMYVCMYVYMYVCMYIQICVDDSS